MVQVRCKSNLTIFRGEGKERGSNNTSSRVVLQKRESTATSRFSHVEKLSLNFNYIQIILVSQWLAFSLPCAFVLMGCFSRQDEVRFTGFPSV